MFKIAVAGSILCLTTISLAGTAYTDFKNGFDYDTTGGYGTGGFAGEAAWQFQAVASGTLSDLFVAFEIISGPGTVPFTLNLYADPGGDTSAEGELLGSWNGSTTFVGTGPVSQTVVTVPACGVQITSGDYYWLGATGPTEVDWMVNEIGVSNHYLSKDSSPGYYSSAAFKVELVPEPAPLPVLGLGIAGFFVRRQRKR